MARRGMGKGRGKGYKNIAGKDPHVHSQSAKGMKQPQRVNELQTRIRALSKFKSPAFQEEKELLKKEMTQATRPDSLKIIENPKWDVSGLTRYATIIKSKYTQIDKREEFFDEKGEPVDKPNVIYIVRIKPSFLDFSFTGAEPIHFSKSLEDAKKELIKYEKTLGM